MNVTHLTNQSQFVQANAAFNGTNISGTIASNGISLSVAPGGGGADGYNILAAGTQTANTTGTVAFSNSNGITFGMSNNSVITASHNGLTTAMASNAGSNFVQATAAFNGTNASGTIASNAISVSVAPQTAFVFSNSNGVSFGTNGSTVTASVQTNYLTTQSAQAFSADASSTFQTLVFQDSNGVSFSNNAGSLRVTHGLQFTSNTSAITSNALHTTSPRFNISAGTTSNNMSAVTFSNLNGVSFGLNGSVVTASVAAAGGAQTGISGIQVSNTTYTSGTVTWQNANGISFGSSGANGISASYTVPTVTNSSWTIIASNATTTVASLRFSDSNGITFGLNPNTLGSAVITASHNGLTTAALSNHSHGNPQLNLTNLSGTTASNSAGFTLSLSAAAPGAGGGIALANSQTTYTSGTAHLSVVGGAMTIASTTGQSFNFSVPALSSFVAVGNATISTNGSTVSISVQSIAAAPVNFSAGTTSNNIGSIVFSNANGVSFGLNGSTITASAAGGGGAATAYVPFGPFSTNSQTLAALGATSASARFFPIYISDDIAFNALRVMHSLSYATSSVAGSQTVSYQYGLFSNNAGTLSSISSGSFSLAVTNSSVSNTVSYPVSTGTAGYTYTTLAATTTAQIQSLWGTAGGRQLDLQFGNTMSLSSGMYWLGVNLRHSSSSANIGISVALAGNANQLFNNVAPWGVNTSAETTNSRYRLPYQGLGAYTVSVSSLPNGVPLTQIAHTQTIMPLVSFLST